MVSGSTLASAHGGVGYLQPGGRASSLSSSSSEHLAAFEGLTSTSLRLFRPLRASPSSSSILQYLKVNERLQTFISQQLYTQSLYSIHMQ